MKDYTSISTTDIRTNNWIEKLLPISVHPYSRLARLDRPIGTWLLLFPCLFGAGLASKGLPDIGLLILFVLGAVTMRGAGCTINDIVDRDFDKQVSRTASRPLPAGTISVTGAIVFLSCQLIIGFLVLIQFNLITIYIGMASIPIIIAYPFTKRITYWPQFFLGLAFNWGALLGWTSVNSELGWPAIFLYMGGIAWTIGYDTIYGHQDRQADKIIGLKSSSLRLGSNTKPWLFSFFLAATILFGVAGWLAALSWVFYLGLAIGLLHFIWQVLTLDINSPLSCQTRFKSNRDYGVILFLAIVWA